MDATAQGAARFRIGAVQNAVAALRVGSARARTVRRERKRSLILRTFSPADEPRTRTLQRRRPPGAQTGRGVGRAEGRCGWRTDASVAAGQPRVDKDNRSADLHAEKRESGPGFSTVDCTARAGVSQPAA